MKPVQPESAWVVVHPIGKMFISTANEHDFLAIQEIEKSLEECWEHLKEKGFRLVRIRMEEDLNVALPFES